MSAHNSKKKPFIIIVILILLLLLFGYWLFKNRAQVFTTEGIKVGNIFEPLVGTSDRKNVGVITDVNSGTNIDTNIVSVQAGEDIRDGAQVYNARTGENGTIIVMNYSDDLAEQGIIPLGTANQDILNGELGEIILTGNLVTVQAGEDILKGNQIYNVGTGINGTIIVMNYTNDLASRGIKPFGTANQDIISGELGEITLININKNKGGLWNNVSKTWSSVTNSIGNVIGSIFGGINNENNSTGVYECKKDGVVVDCLTIPKFECKKDGVVVDCLTVTGITTPDISAYECKKDGVVVDCLTIPKFECKKDGVVVDCLTVTGITTPDIPIYTFKYPTITVSANPRTINSGDSSTISWESTNTKSCDSGTGNPTTTSGHFNTGPLTRSTSFAVVCIGEKGGRVSKSIVVKVNTSGDRYCLDNKVTKTLSRDNPNNDKEQVKIVQTILSRLNNSSGVRYLKTTDIDGNFGKTTFEAVGLFQKDNGLQMNGRVDENTMELLNEKCGLDQLNSPTVTVSADPTTVNPGSSSKISWVSTNVTSCDYGGINSKEGKSGNFDTGPLKEDTSFSVVCIGNNGRASDSVLVRIITTGLAVCNDGINNDNDLENWVDWQDPECHTDGDRENDESYLASWTSESEKPPFKPVCNDDRNNDPDQDSLTDEDDPQCHEGGILTKPYVPTWKSERDNAPITVTPSDFCKANMITKVLSAGSPNNDAAQVKSLQTILSKLKIKNSTTNAKYLSASDIISDKLGTFGRLTEIAVRKFKSDYKNYDSRFTLSQNGIVDYQTIEVIMKMCETIDPNIPTECPEGYTGTLPNCTKKTPTVCPAGSTGTYPNCKCLIGTEKYPNCSCPAGSTGTFPNNCQCIKTGETYPACSCPEGTTGTFPNNCVATNIETNKCAIFDKYPLEFTSVEKAQLAELLRKFYLIAPTLKTEDDLNLLYNEIYKYNGLIVQAEELTQQCYVQKETSPYKEKGPKTVYGNPWYKPTKRYDDGKSYLGEKILIISAEAGENIKRGDVVVNNGTTEKPIIITGKTMNKEIQKGKRTVPLAPFGIAMDNISKGSKGPIELIDADFAYGKTIDAVLREFELLLNVW